MNWIWWVFFSVSGLISIYFFTSPKKKKRTWKNISFPFTKFEKFSPNFYVVTGKNADDPLSRNMTIFKLNNSDLILHSVIAMNEGLTFFFHTTDDMKQLESIGVPKVLIVPNSFHNMDYHLYQEKYKDIIVVSPKHLVSSLPNIDMSIEDYLSKNEELKNKIIIHNPTQGEFEYLYEFRMDENSSVAVMCDQMFNLPNSKGFKGYIQWIMGSTGFFGVTFIGRTILKCMGKTQTFKNVRFLFWFISLVAR
jgi:hypothetical protein